jgi:DNA polymerase-1
MLVVDFETKAIRGNPTVRPPAPVGMAFKRPGFKSQYLAWGHPSGNNCEGPERARLRLVEAIAAGEPLLFHNSKFDVAVAEHYFGLRFPDPLLVHDTIFQVFLYDPYAESFALKPSAERILNWPPEEQETLRAWILAHVQCKPSEWGAYISEAPAELVAPYARGDVRRTLALYEFLQDKVPLAAYQREQRLRPIIMEGERRGVCCDVELLEADVAQYEGALIRVDRQARKILAAPEANLDSGEELADALDKAGLVKEWPLTPTGRRSTARGALETAVEHPILLPLLQYRGALSHCLSNFGRPWLALAQDYNGRLHPEWNQVRQERGNNDVKGTRTGRLSCSKPNFQNPPNEYSIVIPSGLPDLPIMRKYLIPDKGYVWLKRDYSQQELRILAHYSEGRLFDRYQADPRIDAHEETQALIKEHAGIDLIRKHVKITGFSIIYGSGVPHLSKMLGVTVDDGRATRDAYFAALPEVPKLMNDCTRRGRMHSSISTWGGREYYAETPKIVKGRYRSFEYKLLNYLIQGSAADCTKESLIRWNEDKGAGEFLCTVHDENNIQAPVGRWRQDMTKLRTAMESIEFDVKMLSDGYFGKSWATLETCK